MTEPVERAEVKKAGRIMGLDVGDRRDVIDQVAAVLILQSFLDARR